LAAVEPLENDHYCELDKKHEKMRFLAVNPPIFIESQNFEDKSYWKLDEEFKKIIKKIPAKRFLNKIVKKHVFGVFNAP
jgi:hypothetical protein